MDAHELELSRPCPVDLDAEGVDRSSKRFYCGHCDKHVHVLSNMTRAAARAFVTANRGTGVCVSYLRDSEGRVRYAPEPAPAPAPAPAIVPLSRLRARKRAPRLATAALALAACTPHGDGPVVTVDTAESVTVDTARVIPTTRPTPPPAPEVMIEGELAPDPLEQVDGELMAEPVVTAKGELAPEPGSNQPAGEPCDGPKTTTAAPAKTEKKLRGRLPRAPTIERLEVVDGGL